MYRLGPHGINPLADDETLGGAGVAQDGTAELDVLLADLTAAEANELNEMVRYCRLQTILCGQLRLALIPLAFLTIFVSHICVIIFVRPCFRLPANEFRKKWLFGHLD
jgi:hypothetical protein